MKNISQKIFCAFCKLERRVFIKKGLDWSNVLLSFLGASLVMFMLWQRLDARVIIVFVVFIAIAEIFVRTRWRMGLPCPHCAFDPLLYNTNRDEAVKRVKLHLDDLRHSGRHLLRQNNPFINLHSVVLDKSAIKAEANKHKHLSREV